MFLLKHLMKLNRQTHQFYMTSETNAQKFLFCFGMNVVVFFSHPKKNRIPATISNWNETVRKFVNNYANAISIETIRTIISYSICVILFTQRIDRVTVCEHQRKMCSEHTNAIRSTSGLKQFIMRARYSGELSKRQPYPFYLEQLISSTLVCPAPQTPLIDYRSRRAIRQLLNCNFDVFENNWNATI